MWQNGETPGKRKMVDTEKRFTKQFSVEHVMFLSRPFLLPLSVVLLLKTCPSIVSSTCQIKLIGLWVICCHTHTHTHKILTVVPYSELLLVAADFT